MDFDWSIAVFARNEERRIADCLAALSIAIEGARAHVTVIVNGASDGTVAKACLGLRDVPAAWAVHFIPYGCKSHAMNLFIHDLRPRARIYIFMDATIFVEPAALRALADGLESRSGCDGVSGIPVNGRGAARMRRDAMQSSRLFGQLFAVRAGLLDTLVARGRRLPIGLYRCDGLFAGYICHETDGVSHRERANRIATIPDARWRIRPISALDPRDVRVGFNRLIRQARGRLENQAWNTILWTQGFGALPTFADDMIREWLKTSRPEFEPFPARLFTWLALRRIRRGRRPLAADLMAREVCCSPPCREDG
jgi:hypothetical protein